MKLVVSGSKATASVRVGRLLLEVWHHGGVTRLVADDSLCGVVGTHHTRVTRGTWVEMAAAAVEAWRTRRGEWSPCE